MQITLDNFSLAYLFKEENIQWFRNYKCLLLLYAYSTLLSQVLLGFIVENKYWGRIYSIKYVRLHKMQTLKDPISTSCGEFGLDSVVLTLHCSPMVLIPMCMGKVHTPFAHYQSQFKYVGTYSFCGFSLSKRSSFGK